MCLSFDTSKVIPTLSLPATLESYHSTIPKDSLPLSSINPLPTIPMTNSNIEWERVVYLPNLNVPTVG